MTAAPRREGTPARRSWLTGLLPWSGDRDSLPPFWRLVRRCCGLARRLPGETLLTLKTPYWLLQSYCFGRYVERNARRIGTRPRRPGEPVAMMVVSQLPRDPRVERAARTLARNGHRVHLICPSWKSLETPALPPQWGPNITTQLLPQAMSFFRFPGLFDRRMYRALVESNAWVYHCHDLSTCLIGLAAAATTGARVVCDFHEWYSENVTWYRWRRQYLPHSRLKRAVFRWAERLCLRHATRVITVCQSLAEQIRDEFRASRDLTVVRNIPLIQRLSGQAPGQDLRRLTGVSPDTFLVLYQGGVGPSRCLEPIIEGFARVPGVALVIRGPNVRLHEPEYRRLAESFGAGDRLFCLDPVPGDRVVAEASTADAGIWALKDLCINFRCALPNKLFEYLAAGIPVLSADLPEARRLVEGYRVGVCFDAESPESIAAAIRRLAEDADLRRRCRENIPAALEAQRADLEWQKLAELFAEIGGPAGEGLAA